MNHRTKKIFTSLAKFAFPAAIIFWLLWLMEPEH